MHSNKFEVLKCRDLLRAGQKKTVSPTIHFHQIDHLLVRCVVTAIPLAKHIVEVDASFYRDCGRICMC
jgi:hypothetical protein